MTDTEIIKELLLPAACEDIYSIRDGSFGVTIKETHQNEYSLEIRSIPEDSIVIKIDKFKAQDTLFQELKGVRKRADYAIISESKKIIIFIELKASDDPSAFIKQQLKGAQCAVEYIQSIGKVFWDKQAFLNNYTRYYAACCNISIRKKGTKPINKGSHKKIDTFLKISGAGPIYFNKLIRII